MSETHAVSSGFSRIAHHPAYMPHPDPAATDPIRVYVGAVHTHRLMFEVLRWSIRRHTRRTVDVFNIGELLGPTPPLPSKPENRPVTPFSFHRFAVPMLAGWQGRAIYLDSDQLVLRDIAELHDLPMRFGVRLLRRAEHGRDGRTSIHASSVMLLRCDRLRAWSPQRIADDLDSGRYSYPALMKLKPVWLKGSFSAQWNALDHFEPQRTGLLHYTRRSAQPWLARNHPFETPWFEALYSGLDAGEVSAEAVEFAVANQYVRPSFAWQVERRLTTSDSVPEDLRAADAAFLAHCSQRQFNNLDGNYRPPT